MDKFISVKERLPDNLDDALLLSTTGQYYIGYWREDAKKWDNFFFGWLPDDVEIEFWMPLPKWPNISGWED